MIDFVGNELKIGDTVAFMRIGSRSLMKGVIISMGDKKARIQFDKIDGRTETYQFHNQIIKINIRKLKLEKIKNNL